MAGSTGISEELTCSVCLETFDTPMLLPCAHTFCKNCLKNIQEKSRLKRQRTDPHENTLINSLFCPQCRSEIQLGDRGIEGLPRNTSLANIILSLEEEKRTKNIFCEVCDDEPARVASKVCSDCSVTYCSNCFRELHPLRGAFKYHVIKEAYSTITRCVSPVFDMRSGRVTPSWEVCQSGAESESEGGTYDQLELVRRQIKARKKDLNSVQKAVQNLLKSIEDDTEERMRDIRATCSEVNESLTEKEANLLTSVSQQRHESVRQCLGISSEVKAVMLSLDLLEDQVNDIVSITSVHTATDMSNDIASLKDKVTDVNTKSLMSRVKVIPRQPKLAGNRICEEISNLDFIRPQTLISPVLTEISHWPVKSGPLPVTVAWSSLHGVVTYKLSATQKDVKNNQVTTTVQLSADVTSYQLLLPLADTDYDVTLEAKSEGQQVHPIRVQHIRTLPYVHWFRLKFNPMTCHKRIAVSVTKDEILHRKCKLASLHNVFTSASYQRLETLEGAVGDELLPVTPHVYWEVLVHFTVFGKINNSKLLCDIGVCKHSSEDGFTPLCDNQKSYCGYLVKRDSKIVLEFWDGPNRDCLPRSIAVLDLNQEKEKSVKLGFYYDALRRVFMVISPSANAVLAQFNVKFVGLIPVCALYHPDAVFTTIRCLDSPKIPTVLSKIMRGRNS